MTPTLSRCASYLSLGAFDKMKQRISIIIVDAETSGKGVRAPFEQRLRQWLKLGLRGFNLRAEHTPDDTQRVTVAANASNGHHKPTGARQ